MVAPYRYSYANSSLNIEKVGDVVVSITEEGMELKIPFDGMYVPRTPLMAVPLEIFNSLRRGIDNFPIANPGLGYGGPEYFKAVRYAKNGGAFEEYILENAIPDRRK